MVRYEHKWLDHEEPREGWNHYPRRPPPGEWNNEWPQEEPPHVMYAEAEEERIELMNVEYSGARLEITVRTKAKRRI